MAWAVQVTYVRGEQFFLSRMLVAGILQYASIHDSFN